MVPALADREVASMTTMVMAGGTSGLGAVAARRLASEPGCRLLIGARSRLDRSGPPGAELVPVDLAELASVRAFAAEVVARAEAPIDALVLNAGLSFPPHGSSTIDGFEPTVAVNHLAPYLLLRLLLPHLADGGRVVLTTSGTHDPARNTRLPAPRHAEVGLLAHPAQDPGVPSSPRAAAGEAYAASKLCAVLTARAAATRPDVTDRGVVVVAYDPGPTPGTGLARHRGPLLRAAWAVLGSPVGRLVPGLSSRERAGGALADLAAGRVVVPPGQVHVRLMKGHLEWTEPSELARDPDVARALWDDSAALVGLDR